MKNQDSVYSRLPIALQNAACSLKGWQIQRNRFDAQFRECLAELQSRMDWSEARMRDYRDDRIQCFVRHCADTVPYYQDLFKREGIDPCRIRTVEDLSSLPILTKQEVRRLGTLLLSRGVKPSQLAPVHTSGTTGTGLKFSTTRESIREQWAVWWRYRAWHGIRFGEWCGHFGGKSVVPLRQVSPPFWRVNSPGRQIMFSAYHMSEQNMPYYIAELRRRQPRWLHGYPSLLAMVAAHLVNSSGDLGYEVGKVTVGSENLLPQQADIIENGFGVRPTQHYGLAEAVANISECEYGLLHVDEDFAAVEFLQDTLQEGCRLIGTNLSNFAFPLLRYDTQDIVEPSADLCRCGRPGRIVHNIDGRREDYIILKNGVRLGRLYHAFTDMVNVRESQIHQVRIGEITINVVRGDNYGPEDERKLLLSVKKLVGDDTVIHIRYVEKLQRSKTGKLRFVISEIDQGTLLAPVQTKSTNDTCRTKDSSSPIED